MNAHTFLFTDLVGYTALCAEEGDERGLGVALEFQRRVRGLLAAHGAEEVKAIGDALMLRCSSPADGVRLGVAIVRELEAIPGFPAVRVGVHSGPAIGHDGDWYGGAVNVASRLCSAAGGGEVLVSEATASAAGEQRGIVLGEGRPHWLKGVSEPVAARPAEAAELPREPPAAAAPALGRRRHECSMQDIARRARARVGRAWRGRVLPGRAAADGARPRRTFPGEGRERDTGAPARIAQVAG